MCGKLMPGASPSNASPPPHSIIPPSFPTAHPPPHLPQLITQVLDLMLREVWCGAQVANVQLQLRNHIAALVLQQALLCMLCKLQRAKGVRR